MTDHKHEVMAHKWLGTKPTDWPVTEYYEMRPKLVKLGRFLELVRGECRKLKEVQGG